jgi:twinkle protein
MSDVLYSARCPACAAEGRDNSGDNLKVYDDGHGFCYACSHRIRDVDEFAASISDGYAGELGLRRDTSGVEGQHRGSSGFHRGHGMALQARDSGANVSGDAVDSGSSGPLKMDGTYSALTSRGITEETCRFWDYQIGTYKGQRVQVAAYKDDSGRTLAHKVRTKEKDFLWDGATKECGLYGKWLWRAAGKMVVVTEGELDALSVSQAQGNKWPVVSLRNGAAGAVKCIQKDLEWLEGFETVVLWFDNDEPGLKAAEKCAAILSPGKCKIARAPQGYKDANDLLKANLQSKIIDVIWSAKEYRPDGIVCPADLLSEALKPVAMGLPYPWPALTQITYGIRRKELIGIGAGTGVGKTDFVQEIILHLIHKCDTAVGLFFLEESPVLTLKKLAGKLAGKRFHIPNPLAPLEPLWTAQDLSEAVGALGNNIRLYDHFGVIDWEIIKTKIRYLAKAEGIKVFVIDNLTALVADAADERKALEQILAEMSGLSHELDATIFFVSHLATPESGSHEEGSRVQIRHFKGSRAIGFWSHFMIGLERDQQADEEAERNTTTVRVLKDRYTGNGVGFTFKLKYDKDLGRMVEGPDSFDECPF